VCGSDQAARTFEYMCGVEVAAFDAIPRELGRMRVPAQRYAVFTHRGHVAALRATWDAIWREWLPRSGEHPANTPDFERYDARFDPQTGSGEIEIWFPVAGAGQARWEPGPSYAVRRATAADWPAIWPIIAEVAAGGDTYTLDPETSEADARDYWMGPGQEVYVAEGGGQVVGTYTMRANQRGLGSHVANAGYMVRPGHAGRGIGTLLAEHSLVAARAAGFEAMQFNAVVSTNARAVALWQRLGFTIVGTVPRAFRHRTLGDVDLHVMHRFL
jgi:ribosomal protein S18 acetylase RimI-like enzyme